MVLDDGAQGCGGRDRQHVAHGFRPEPTRGRVYGSPYPRREPRVSGQGGAYGDATQVLGHQNPVAGLLTHSYGVSHEEKRGGDFSSEGGRHGTRQQQVGKRPLIAKLPQQGSALFKERRCPVEVRLDLRQGKRPQGTQHSRHGPAIPQLAMQCQGPLRAGSGPLDVPPQKCRLALGVDRVGNTCPVVQRFLESRRLSQHAIDTGELGEIGNHNRICDERVYTQPLCRGIWSGRAARRLGTGTERVAGHRFLALHDR